MSLKFVQRTNSRSESVLSALAYEAHFGLTEKAFGLNADPRFVYDSASHIETSQRLLAGIRRREGLLVLTGEIGTGKTTLCRGVLRDLGRNTHGSLVPDPFASREDLLKMLLVDFGKVSIQEVTAGPLRQASRTELGYLLAEFLDSLPADAFAVAVIDEAQNLSLPLIEETRLLSDTFGAKGRLQIVLVGQPELHAKLKSPEMRQVDQRVCGYHRLAPMSRDGVAGYIHHRLQVAGVARDRVLFPPEIVEALHGRSGGVPRLINRVCDRALQLAYEQRADAVNREILDTALLQIGAATLSPTWDSIVHAQSKTARPAAHTGVDARPAITPANSVDTTPAIDDREDFHKQVDHWVARDLAAPPPPADARSAKPASRRASSGSPKRAYRNDWPRDVRSETYIQRFLRMWAKRAAIAVAVFLMLNAALAGMAIVGDMLAPAAPPAVPAAPARVPVTVAAALPPPAHVGSGAYLVAVGLFSDRQRADQLVDSLNRAGLPAMQRAFQLRRERVQQIVLGPYVSRTDADSDLRRLQQLGAHDDARVVVDSQ